MGSSGKGATLAAVREVAAPSGTANRLESGMRPATRRRVLLVEDEDMVRKVLTRMLVARGFDVQAAASGSEAIAIFDARDARGFDLLVTDLMLPEGGGLVVARHLSDQLPDLRILFVSGYSSANTEGLEPESFRFLTKPFGSTELGRVIDDLFQPKP
jgi:two-component system cell cycle sensor histidine kinase/response regulator CckA